jgi:hypothetical protein
VTGGFISTLHTFILCGNVRTCLLFLRRISGGRRFGRCPWVEGHKLDLALFAVAPRGRRLVRTVRRREGRCIAPSILAHLEERKLCAQNVSTEIVAVTPCLSTALRTACFLFSASLRLILRPHRCHAITAATAKNTPATAPPAIAPTGTVSTVLLVEEGAAATWSVGVLVVNTVVVRMVPFGVSTTTEVAVITVGPATRAEDILTRTL